MILHINKRVSMMYVCLTVCVLRIRYLLGKSVHIFHFWFWSISGFQLFCSLWGRGMDANPLKMYDLKKASTQKVFFIEKRKLSIP